MSKSAGANSPRNVRCSHFHAERGNKVGKPKTMTWQDAITIIIVLVALGYVVRLAARSGRQSTGQPGCQGCRNCPDEPPEKPLVTLDEVHRGVSEDSSPGAECRDSVRNPP